MSTRPSARGEQAAGLCPYANIGEQCDNFTTTAEFTSALAHQLTDLQVLCDDAEARGWQAEAARNGRVVEHLEKNLRRVKRSAVKFRRDVALRAG